MFFLKKNQNLAYDASNIVLPVGCMKVPSTVILSNAENSSYHNNRNFGLTTDSGKITVSQST